jgi:hypothetical protein
VAQEVLKKKFDANLISVCLSFSFSPSSIFWTFTIMGLGCSCIIHCTGHFKSGHSFSTILRIFCLFVCLFCHMGAWTQGLQLETNLCVCVCVIGFFKIGSSRTICPGWLQTKILLTSASWVTRITDMSTSTQGEFSWFISLMISFLCFLSFFLCVFVYLVGFLFVLLFFFFFAVLGFGLRASCLLGRCSITWATPPALLSSISGTSHWILYFLDCFPHFLIISFPFPYLHLFYNTF